MRPFQKNICFFIFILTSFFSTVIYADNPGIIFVHGTSDHRFDAEGGYWQTSFLTAVAQGLPNPSNYFVVHCDFREYMWAEPAAGCLLTQAMDFIQQRGITRVTVYAHSDGANVIRFILSNPTFDERYYAFSNKVDKVIALAPSSGGTILADEVIDGSVVFEGVGWLLGYQSNAVRQQRTQDMYIYNSNILLGSADMPALPKPFNVVVGTDVIASPINSHSYCNGYLLNAALKLTKTYLKGCSDGFLTCDSQATAGNIWFYDYEKTLDNMTLSHNQSRHACAGLDNILRTDLTRSGDIK